MLDYLVSAGGFTPGTDEIKALEIECFLKHGLALLLLSNSKWNILEGDLQKR